MSILIVAGLNIAMVVVPVILLGVKSIPKHNSSHIDGKSLYDNDSKRL